MRQEKASSKGSDTSSEADEAIRQEMEDSARMAEMPSIYDAEEHFSVAERRPATAKAGASATGASAAAFSAARTLEYQQREAKVMPTSRSHTSFDARSTQTSMQAKRKRTRKNKRTRSRRKQSSGLLR